ncbi:MAG TPA: hypothetical protein VKE24_08085 [Candidatus Acidoferrales bacterium]|nr:hypothetical protein [Candidatus Acidoferrales bacterium]
MLCHTLSKDEQRRLISAVREARRLLPIVCIKAQRHDSHEPGCVETEGDPVELVKSLKLAIQFPPQGQAGTTSGQNQ